MSNKVVLCIDSSDKSDSVFDYYRNNLHRPGNELIVLHVSDQVQVPPIPSMGGATIMDKDLIHSKLEHVKKQNEELKSKFQEKCLEANIPGKVETVHGESGVGPAILSNIAKHNASSVVVGSRGLGLIRRTVLGSVSNYILHHSNVPVVVYPTHNTKLNVMPASADLQDESDLLT